MELELPMLEFNGSRFRQASQIPVASFVVLK